MKLKKLFSQLKPGRFLVWMFMPLWLINSALANGPTPTESALSLRKELSALELTSVPSDRLETAWQKIFESILIEGGRSNKSSSFKGHFLSLMSDVFKSISAKKQVYFLNEATREKLQIKKMICSEEGSCNEMVAYYLPYIDSIFIDENLSEEDFAFYLFHELLHAFQYAYRFPLDTAMLADWDNSNLRDYLSFYYEAQANWYTFKLSRNLEWLDVARTGWTLFPPTFAKILVGLVTLGGSAKLGNYFFEQILPEVDFAPSNDGHFHISQSDLFNFSELIVLRSTDTSFNLGTNVDLGFHKRFTRAIEKAYFGKLPFLFAEDAGDQKKFVQLHNQYYKNIIDSSELESSGCRILLNKVLHEGESPLLQWLTLPRSEISACPVYLRSEFNSKRELIQSLMGPSEKSPFYLNHGAETGGDGGSEMGGEGAGPPGLRIHPALYFLPQLKIKPEDGQ